MSGLVGTTEPGGIRNIPHCYCGHRADLHFAKPNELSNATPCSIFPCDCSQLRIRPEHELVTEEDIVQAEEALQATRPEDAPDHPAELGTDT